MDTMITKEEKGKWVVDKQWLRDIREWQIWAIMNEKKNKINEIELNDRKI